jgi:hypothetical protein
MGHPGDIEIAGGIEYLAQALDHDRVVVHEQNGNHP